MIVNVWRRWRQVRNMPLRLEFILSDYCNLNCRGCTHYSPLARKEFISLEKVSQVMEHLGQVCGGGVESAYLMGGETLLYPDLTGAMEALRRSFPTQKLYIFTNGLLLPKMDDDFWRACRRYGFILAITRYPIKFDYDSVIALCASKGVETVIFGDRTKAGSFFRFSLDPAGRQNARIAHFKCYNRGCVSVLGDYVYPCSISACVGHLNDATGTSFEHLTGDSLYYRNVGSAADIRRLRDRPVPFCRYCRQPQVVPYGPSRREPDEWI